MNFLLLTRTSEYDNWVLLNNRIYKSLLELYPALEEYLIKNPTHETVVVQGETFSGRECLQSFWHFNKKKGDTYGNQ